VIEHFLATPSQVSQQPAPQAVSPATEDTTTDQPPPESDETADSPPPESDAYLAGLDKKLVELRIKRTVLLLKYTNQHPDVVQVDRQLEQLRAERRRYLKRLQKN